jgi:hypothetical protein
MTVNTQLTTKKVTGIRILTTKSYACSDHYVLPEIKLHFPPTIFLFYIPATELISLTVPTVMSIPKYKPRSVLTNVCTVPHL